MPHPQVLVLVVGAGPTGLNMALSLARRGVSVRIIDRSDGPAEASRAVVVHARTLEFYRQLGFGDEVAGLGVKAETMHLRKDGKDVARLDLSNMGKDVSPYPFALCFPQDDHERFLNGKLAESGLSVEWGRRLADFEQDERGVRAEIEGPDGRETVEAAFLCGCDGGHSRVRERLGIGFEGGSYAHLFYVADAKIEGPFQTDGFINLGADGFNLMLPVRSSGMQRLIGIVPDALADRRDLSFEDVRASVEPLLGVHVERVNWFSTYHVHHRVADRFGEGRCFLSGDAAHVHSPAGGQGMNTGIGDAVNLAWKIAEVVHGRADRSLLETYGPERIAFARTLVATTDRAFRGLVAKGVEGWLIRTWLMPRLMPLVTRFAAGRSAMFKAVSQIRVAYPGSALSDGEADGVSGGDRLPWVPLQDGSDNFAPLASLGWQVHVHGGDDDGFAARLCAAGGPPAHRFAWTEAAERVGLKQGAACLVRPDGYVALASSRTDVDEIMEYARRRSIRF